VLPLRASLRSMGLGIVPTLRARVKTVFVEPTFWSS